MKLERIQEYVLPVAVTVGGMLVALYLGFLMGEGQFSKVALFLGALFIAFVTLIMRQYVWLLIILAWPWSGQIPVLPLPFAVKDLAIIAVFAATLALIALKVVRRKPTYTTIDLVMALMLIYMVSVFIRNPVGLQATNSFRVGGRPYLNTFIAFLAYWVLARSSLRLPGPSKVYIFAVLLSNFAVTGLNLICDLSTKATRLVVNFYTGIASASDLDGAAPSAAPGQYVERRGYLLYAGGPLTTALFSFYRPLEVINPLYFWRLFLFCGGSFMLLLSGFRTSIVALVGFAMISGYLRAGFFESVKMLIVGALAISIVVAGNGRVYELPLSAQRALCFLPGKWNPVAKADAEASADWRFQMWARMLSTNRYIKNRVLGDGFGVSKLDMETIGRLNALGVDDQESVMILGNVHSGPISTIRVAGYAGFAIFLLLTVQIAVAAARAIRRATGTPIEAMAYFISLPLIFEPFNFVFIFGGFDSALPTTIFSLGVLKMLENTINDHEPVVVPEEPHVPLHRRQVSRPEPALALRAPH